MSNEHPILFTGPMVQAILAGRKTQTRRVMKPQPPTDTINVFTWFAGEKKAGFSYAPEGCWYDAEGGRRFHRPCPYGVPGDRLWVRETLDNEDGDWVYAVDHESLVNEGPEEWRRRAASKGYVPSIHMPRWASSILLEITDIRVERVQDITEDDAFAEGIKGGDWLGNPVGEFKKLWDSINARRGYPWADEDLPDNLKTGHGRVMYGNPWVWVVTFEKAKGD